MAKAPIQVYKGNANLKSAGVTLDFDKEKVEELTKCYNDPVYFIRKYIKIVHIDRGLVPFDLYDYQVKMVEHILGNRHAILKLPRQSGKSIVCAACVLWYLLFQEEKTVAILANKGATAREILGRIQYMYLSLPKWMQVGVTSWNKGSFSLGNNNSMIAAATSSSAIRGMSISWLLCDEAAFVPANQFQEFFDSVYPTISSGKESKITMFSTPKGLNHFHKFWVEAKNGTSEFKPFEISWDDVPGRDEQWKERTIATIGIDSWLQEFECEFLASAGTLVSAQKIASLAWKIPVRRHDDFRIYEEPMEKRRYFATVDVARGGGGDYSTIQVIDITEKPYRQVAVYSCNTVDYVRFAEVIYDVCKSYNAKCLIETNDLGEAVARDLFENMDFDGLLYCDGESLGGFSVVAGKVGLKTTARTKRIGCSDLKILIENDVLLICDEETIKELSLFTYQKGTYMAEEGFHDDLVMGLVLFAVAAHCDNFTDFAESPFEWKEELHMEADLMPFGLYDDGIEEAMEVGSKVIDVAEL